MSAELPGLERLLADAAERHYGRRRPRLWLPRPAVVAPLAVAALVVALAIAVFPLGSDEQAATPPRTDDPAAPLADSYGVFADQENRESVAVVVLEAYKDVFDSAHPVSTWPLRTTGTSSVVALAGTGRDGEPTLCLWRGNKQGDSVGCTHIGELVSSSDPWAQIGFQPGIGHTFTALVPDDVTLVRIELKGGASRDLEIANNLAYATSDQPICGYRWKTSDGDAGAVGGGTFGGIDKGEPQPPTC
jgi:hypothetical protein